ncbi:MAG: NFACT RNA binding domain-containing protein [Bacteroidota bacterium]
MDYFTLRALARDWTARLGGARVEAAWTQSPRELSLALHRGGEDHTLRVVCDPALPLLFRTDGAGRQRRNTADVFDGLAGRTVTEAAVAERDRHLLLHLDDGGRLQVVLFGPRPNVVWVEGETVRDAFLDADAHLGAEAPAVRPAPIVDTLDAFEARWRPDRKTLAQAVAAAVPLFTRALAAEAVRRAGLDPEAAPDRLGEGDRQRLFEAAQRFEADLLDPRPHVYWRGALAEAVTLAPLADPPEAWRAEAFETVDHALGVFAKRRLAQRAYDGLYRPAERTLARAARKKQRSANAMLDELAQPSRADRYEAWGHLLMASASGQGPGQDEATLPDLLGDGAPITIPLDPALSAVENAERYYDKARRTRRAREEAEARWGEVHAEAEALADLLVRLRATETVPALRTLLDAEAAAFDRLGGGRDDGPAEPFRRIALPGGFEALVGKHARGNAHLTTRVASPHDLWLHARGVPGSHVVVKRPGRSSEVPPEAVQAAARVAAHFSTAKTQTVVPVTVTEKKYVRPIKGGPPGLVRVDREDVLDVAPGLP